MIRLNRKENLTHTFWVVYETRVGYCELALYTGVLLLYWYNIIDRQNINTFTQPCLNFDAWVICSLVSTLLNVPRRLNIALRNQYNLINYHTYHSVYTLTTRILSSQYYVTFFVVISGSKNWMFWFSDSSGSLIYFYWTIFV